MTEFGIEFYADTRALTEGAKKAEQEISGLTDFIERADHAGIELGGSLYDILQTTQGLITSYISFGLIAAATVKKAFQNRRCQ